MTRTEATADLNKTLGQLSDEQVEALAAIAHRLAKTAPVEEDDVTRAAIAEGVEQAKRGRFVAQKRVDELIKKSWR